MLLGLFLFCIFVFTSQAHAISISENFDSSVNNWMLNGSAEWNDEKGVVILTHENFYEAGSMWYKQSFDLSKYKGFEAEFDFFVGDKDTGADGITFAVINTSNGLNALGGSGGDLGYEGISNSFAIEFDTYENSSFNDPSKDHIGIDTNGSLTSLKTFEIGNIEDGEWHHAKIDFKIGTGKVSIWLDQSYIGEYTISGFSPFEAYFGFTGGTGAGYNLQRIDNFKLTLNPVPIPSSLLLIISGLIGSFYLRKEIF